MEYYIGIDVGSSSTKLILMNQDGLVVKQCSRHYNAEQPKAGWIEIDPEIWFMALTDGLDILLNGIDTKSVKAVGMTGQLHTTVFLDKEGKLIRPAIMWNDNRTKDYVPYLKHKIMEFPGLSSISNILTTGSPAANLYWLKNNEPKNFEKLGTFLIGPDYLVYRLTGNIGTDYSKASTSSLYDLQKKQWSPEVRQIIGLPESVYPEIHGSAQTAGPILPQFASKYGFKPNTMVIFGAGDNPASAISTGCITKNYPVLSLGTSGVLMVPMEIINKTSRGKKILLSSDGKEFITLVQGVIQSTGSDMAWWLHDILKSNDLDNENSGFSIDRLGESDLLFYPHLAGEKTIYADPDQHGAFLGLSTDTTRTEMTQAINEGICFAVKQLAESMSLADKQLYGLRVVGGGSQNSIWMQMMADVLNVEIKQLDGNISAAYGIALLTMCADGSCNDLNRMIDRSVFVKQSFYPRTYNAGLYRNKYKKYQRIHDALKNIYIAPVKEQMPG